MPELPEVETIIRRLRNGTQNHPPLPGNTIQAVQVTWDRTIAEPDPSSFQLRLVGKQITDACRRGKFLHFPLNEGHLIAHLRMSGDMRMEKRISPDNAPLPPAKYDRVILDFTSCYRLAFNNVRKFGRMWYVEDAQTVFHDLGIEPLSAEFTPDHLYKILHAHSRQIKPLLMDQKLIAGMGNIYTDESLFRAKLHPLRKSDSLSLQETENLYHAVRDILNEGIRRSGASLDWVYRGGQFQNTFKVYQREGEACYVCGKVVEKIIVGQRSSHFCPNCQKL
jgi:formamidopyrimidine-DNA glycosylase